jgi:hypothetical protein
MLTGIPTGYLGMPPETKKDRETRVLRAFKGNLVLIITLNPHWFFQNLVFRIIASFNSEQSRTVSLLLRELQTIRFLLNHSHP